jgi:hypothetical protein
MFVAITLTANTQMRRSALDAGMTAYNTPTLVGFCGVLVLAGFLGAPWPTYAVRKPERKAGKATMTTWTGDELEKVGNAEELEIASRRADGTLRQPVTIWVVRHGDDLYVRAVRGRDGWFRGTQTRREGRIEAGGIEKDMRFEDAGSGLNDAIDAVYRSKYRRYSANVLGSILTPAARSSTIKLVPITYGGAPVVKSRLTPL